MGWFDDFFDDVKEFFESAVDFVVDVFNTVVDVVLSPFGVGNFNTPSYNDSQVQEAILGPLLNKDSGVGNIPIVYGRRRVGGFRVFISTNGTDNEYLFVALVMSEGQIDGLEKIYIDDTEVPMSSYAHGVEATPTSGPYLDRMTTQFFDGRDDQTVSSLLDAAPGWGSNHRLRGLAYVAARFRWLKIDTTEAANNNPFRSGVPKISCLIRGRKIFDVNAAYSPSYAGSITNHTASFTTPSFTSTTTSVSHVTAPPTANYTSTISFTTTESSATIASTVVASVRSRGVAGEFQAVQVSQVLTNTGTSQVVTGDFDRTTASSGPVSTNTQTQVSAVIDRLYSVPTGTYTLTTTVTLTGNGPQVGIPAGSMTINAALGLSATSANNTAYASETITYNNNPVNVLLDYMRNPRYGKGLENSLFEWDTFRLAAQQCNQIVPYTTSTTGKFSEFDGVLDTGDTILNNIRTILASFRALMPYQSGKYYLKIPHGGNPSDIDAAVNPPPVVYTITDDIMLGGLKIQGESKDRKLNQVRITFTDPDADYQPNDVIWPPEDSQVYTDYLTEDNIPLEQNITLAHCTNRERAINYAETVVKTSRNKMLLTLGTTAAAANISVGDLVQIVNKNLNFDGIYRIEGVGLSAEGSLQFQATEHNSNDYILDGHAAAPAKPSINLPDPLQVSAPTNLTVQSGAAFNIANTNGYVQQDATIVRVFVDWLAGTDPYITEYIVQYKLSSDSDYTTAGLTNSTDFFITGVAVGQQIDVRVAARNELDRRSDFVQVSNHTVAA